MEKETDAITIKLHDLVFNSRSDNFLKPRIYNSLRKYGYIFPNNCYDWDKDLIINLEGYANCLKRHWKEMSYFGERCYYSLKKEFEKYGID